MQKVILCVVLWIIASLNGFSQPKYFGQNKQRNRVNNFSILQSNHFELYNYLENKSTAENFLKNSERWYKHHQEVFKLSFIQPNPIILYNNHPEFQETTAIHGEISEGTGGVTEGFRNRVIMPMMFTKRQTNHVLGHELVHAFQYQTMSHAGDSTNYINLNNVPLFMIEGLAEYMSIGRVDAHTAMWLRDAVISEDIPTINDLINKPNQYFPYRWGQAFWAYITSKYGDDLIRPLFKETAIYGIERAFYNSFKMDLEHFSARFKNDLIQNYSKLKSEKETEVRGEIIHSKNNNSDWNISPSISPDGRFIAFISSQNILSMDILILDAISGKVVKKFENEQLGSHVDAYSFIETAGTWSPDSRKFALVIQSKGKNKVQVIDLFTEDKRVYTIKEIGAISNPAWSPDGNSMVFSGLKDGNSDLYILNLKNEGIENLTNDIYSDIQPAWSSNSDFIYFVSDRTDKNLRLEKAKFGISRIDVHSKKIETFDFLKESDNMNPVLGPDTNKIYFLSDLNGIRNLYVYDLESKNVKQLTNYFTGISGITMYSPALSMAINTGEIVYNYYFNGEYKLIKADLDDFLDITPNLNFDHTAAVIFNPNYSSGNFFVDKNLSELKWEEKIKEEKFVGLKYRSKFKLDYLANSGLGVSSSRFGTGMGGGISALFGDMLNNNQLLGTVALNGEIQDFGAQLFYLNQKSPVQFGASFSHIPFRFFGGTSYKIIDTVGYSSNGLTYYNAEVEQKINRLFIDELSFFVLKPFSKNKRIEVGASQNWYSFNIRSIPQSGQIGVGRGGQVLDFIPNQSGRIRKIDPSELGLNAFSLSQIYLAFVSDNTTFGSVAPLKGHRYRLEYGKFFGTASYNAVLVDARKYQYLKPFTLAGRFIYNGRINASNLEVINQINPLFLGFPWNMHGFWGNALNKQIGSISQENLQGEQIALVNLELRLPFTGQKKLALIDFQYLPSDLNLFVDAGMAWKPTRRIGDSYTTDVFGKNTFNFRNSPIVTTGVSLRMNILGYLILEPYIALPYYNTKKQALISGINFMVAGW
jgi:Tol biopolymer transport system component